MANQNFAKPLNSRKETFHDERFDECLVMADKFYYEMKNEEDKLIKGLRWLKIESNK